MANFREAYERGTMVKKFLISYLIFGALWAGSFGIQTMTLRFAGGEHEYYDFASSVSSASITAEGNLLVCVIGQIEQNATTSATSSVPYQMTIPVVELWSDPEKVKTKGFVIFSPDWLFVPRQWTADGCDSNKGQTIPIVVIPETNPSDFFDGLNKSERAQLAPPSGHQHAIFVSPISSDGATFSKHREIDYVAAQPNVLGTTAYQLRVEPLRKEAAVPFWKWPFAVVIDMLFWPIEMVMWANYHH